MKALSADKQIFKNIYFYFQHVIYNACIRSYLIETILNKTENATHIFKLKKSSYFIFRNKMKSHMKISFFSFHLLETHVRLKWYLQDRHFILQKKKKKIEIENAFRPF